MHPCIVVHRHIVPEPYCQSCGFKGGAWEKGFIYTCMFVSVDSVIYQSDFVYFTF